MPTVTDKRDERQELAVAAEELRAQSVGLMRRAANRCQEAEKLSWSLAYTLEVRPNERRVLEVLSELLHEYLSDTAAMVKTIPYLRLEASRLEAEAADDDRE